MSYRENTYAEEKKKKSRKPNEAGPSFSSALLEKICRSIDSPQDSKPKPTNKKPSYLHRPKPTAEDESETRAFVRACLADQKPVPKTTPTSDNIFSFFGSTSSSSSDTSGSLDVDFPVRPRPRPIRTGASAGETTKDYDHTTAESKSKALMRLYANLKKARHPVSPGGRLTGFVASLFGNAANGKKSKNEEEVVDRSAYSHSRSCMGKYSSGSRERATTAQRTVRFNPMRMIVGNERGKYGKKPPLAGKESKGHKSKRLNDFVPIVVGVEYDEVEDEYDRTSDSSSDLFELEHLTMFENINGRRVCEELPVYETTYFETDRVGGGRLIR